MMASLERKDKGWTTKSNNKTECTRHSGGKGSRKQGVLEISYGWQSIGEHNSNMYLLPSFFKSLEKCLEQTHPTCVFDGEANVFPA